MNPYQNLADAIILQAVKDYRHVLRRYAAYPHNSEVNRQRHELETFFRSGWFEMLTDLDGEILLEKLQAEIFGKGVVA